MNSRMLPEGAEPLQHNSCASSVREIYRKTGACGRRAGSHECEHRKDETNWGCDGCGQRLPRQRGASSTKPRLLLVVHAMRTTCAAPRARERLRCAREAGKPAFAIFDANYPETTRKANSAHSFAASFSVVRVVGTFLIASSFADSASRVASGPWHSRCPQRQSKDAVSSTRPVLSQHRPHCGRRRPTRLYCRPFLVSFFSAHLLAFSGVAGKVLCEQDSFIARLPLRDVT